jgi:hypothetical protein
MRSMSLEERHAPLACGTASHAFGNMQTYGHISGCQSLRPTVIPYRHCQVGVLFAPTISRIYGSLEPIQYRRDTALSCLAL